jgi:hypothetical protein
MENQGNARRVAIKGHTLGEPDPRFPLLLATSALTTRSSPAVLHTHPVRPTVSRKADAHWRQPYQ